MGEKTAVSGRSNGRKGGNSQSAEKGEKGAWEALEPLCILRLFAVAVGQKSGRHMKKKISDDPSTPTWQTGGEKRGGGKKNLVRFSQPTPTHSVTGGWSEGKEKGNRRR